ncbi:hypothetical protein LXL04_005466 [Taraxacum kok-saghyz]
MLSAIANLGEIEENKKKRKNPEPSPPSEPKAAPSGSPSPSQRDPDPAPAPLQRTASDPAATPVNLTEHKSVSLFIFLLNSTINSIYDPRTNEPIFNVMWPPTEKVRLIPISSPFPENTLHDMLFWAFDETDYLWFREQDIRELARTQFITCRSTGRTRCAHCGKRVDYSMASFTQRPSHNLFFLFRSYFYDELLIADFFCRSLPLCALTNILRLLPHTGHALETNPPPGSLPPHRLRLPSPPSANAVRLTPRTVRKTSHSSLPSSSLSLDPWATGVIQVQGCLHQRQRHTGTIDAFDIVGVGVAVVGVEVAVVVMGSENGESCYTTAVVASAIEFDIVWLALGSTLDHIIEIIGCMQGRMLREGIFNSLDAYKRALGWKNRLDFRRYSCIPSPTLMSVVFSCLYEQVPNEKEELQNRHKWRHKGFVRTEKYDCTLNVIIKNNLPAFSLLCLILDTISHVSTSSFASTPKNSIGRSYASTYSGNAASQNGGIGGDAGGRKEDTDGQCRMEFERDEMGATVSKLEFANGLNSPLEFTAAVLCHHSVEFASGKLARWRCRCPKIPIPSSLSLLLIFFDILLDQLNKSTHWLAKGEVVKDYQLNYECKYGDNNGLA